MPFMLVTAYLLLVVQVMVSNLILIISIDDLYSEWGSTGDG